MSKRQMLLIFSALCLLLAAAFYRSQRGNLSPDPTASVRASPPKSAARSPSSALASKPSASAKPPTVKSSSGPLFQDAKPSNLSIDEVSERIGAPILRYREVYVNPNFFVSLPEGQKTKVKLQLFDDSSVEVSFEARRSAIGESKYWSGRDESELTVFADFTLYHGFMAATINVKDRFYYLNYSGEGHYFLVEADRQKIYHANFKGEDVLEYPSSKRPPSAVRSRGSSSGLASAGQEMAQAVGAANKMVVLYTSLASAYAGGAGAVQAEIVNETNRTNAALAGSGVAFGFDIGHMAETGHGQNPADMGNDLIALASPNDGDMDEAFGYAASTGSSVLKLYVANNTATQGGIAYLGSEAFVSLMGAAVSSRLTRSTMAYGHELGHVFGANHNATASQAPSGPAYARGHVNVALGYFTILSYWTSCGSTCSVIPFYSNPAVNYYGSNIGNGATEDNARRINEMHSARAAAWSNPNPNPTPTPVPTDPCVIDITQQPQSLAVVVGNAAHFEVGVSARGQCGGLRYFWYMNGSYLTPSGQTLDFITTGANNGNRYSVQIVSGSGVTVSSTEATLVLYSPPGIGNQPVDETVVEGNSATFYIGVAGNPYPVIQWRKDGVDLPYGRIEVTNNFFLPFTLDNVRRSQAGVYDAVVSNAYGSVTSAQARLIVLYPPAITAQPPEMEIFVPRAGTISIFANADGNPAPTFTWYRDGQAMSGPNPNGQLTIANAVESQSGNYYMIATNRVGSAWTRSVRVTVYPPPVIVTQPASLSIVPETGALEIPALARGLFMEYRWRKNGVNLTSPSAATTKLSLTPAQRTQNGTYSLVVSNPAGSVVTDGAQVRVQYPATLTAHPVGVTVARKQKALFRARAVGDPEPTFQWFHLFEGKKTLLTGQTKQDLELLVDWSDQGKYHCEVKNYLGAETTSDASLDIMSVGRGGEIEISTSGKLIKIQRTGGFVEVDNVGDTVKDH